MLTCTIRRNVKESVLGLVLVSSSAAMTLGTVVTGYLSRTVGVLGGVCVYLVVGGALALATLPATGGIHRIVDGLALTSPWLALPGIVNVGLIASQLKVVTTVGAGVLTGGLFVGQLVAGVALDQLGAFGQPEIGLSLKRILGVLVALAGLAVYLVGRRRGESAAADRRTG